MTNQVYRLPEFKGFDSLTLNSESIPKPSTGQVLVRFHAVSLNFRDLVAAKGKYPAEKNVVPASDGAGVVEQVGDGVTSVAKGDRVCPNFTLDHIGGDFQAEYRASTLGGGCDGCLRQYGVFPAQSVVKIPKHLSFEEAACLPCAALTAWNALTCNDNVPLLPGQNVLVEGTGGVSIFGLQFALAAGANVVVISSSDDKLARAKQLGATHTINYKTTPEWQEKVMQVTNGVGVHHVVEVGGENTFLKAMQCLVINGSISIIGFVGGTSKEPVTVNSLIMQTIPKQANIRGLLVGSVQQFNAMNAAMETHKIRPNVDKVFAFKDAKAAYQYQWDQAHFGKVVIKVE